MAKGNFVRLEDMSEVERRSWATLIVDVAVFIWFLGKMTPGFNFFNNPRLSETGASSLVGIYVGVIIVTIILHAVIASIFAVRAGEDKGETDERDVDISRKGAAAGFWWVTVGVNILAGALLLQYAAASGAETFMGGLGGSFPVIEPPYMFFALMVLAFVGDIVKNAVMVLAYRGE